MRSPKSMAITIIAVIIVGVGITPLFVMGLSTGPPDERTGAPGESNCTVGCHSSFPLNSGNGLLSINAPSQYTVSDTIDVTINLSHTGQSRWGFELTALDASNQPAGEIIITEVTRTQLSLAISGRQYIKHTVSGTDNGTLNSAPGWSFKWKAPDTDIGTVTFYAAGNAANGNGLNTGDYIYTTTRQIGLLLSVDDYPAGLLLPKKVTIRNYPNPFNTGTIINYTIPSNSLVELSIYNILGEIIVTLVDDERPAGDYEVSWDGANSSGITVATGVYFGHLTAGNHSETRMMMYLK